jgi:acetyl-CoA synthetase
MREGDEWVKRPAASRCASGSVGEPINPEAWEWYHKVVGEGRCPIVDTWWQTETGGTMITPARRHGVEARLATRPFFGVQPLLLDNDGTVMEGPGDGCLVIADSGRARCAACGAMRIASSRPISPPLPAITSPATAAAATRTAITGSPAASTMSSTSRATAWARRKSNRAGRP